MIRKVLKVLSLLILVVLILAVFMVHRLRTGPAIESKTLAVDGLQAPVEVLYDSMGVPHIFAQSLEDLFLAQGHVHATHRLWQMEMFRRVQEGRLSEIFGESMVDTDRFLRTIGLGEAAKRSTPSPGSYIHGFMERYAQGVNAAIDGWEGFLPPEFVLLRLDPEPWTPVLIQGIEKIMAWDLSDYQTGLSLASAREVLGDSALAPLMPRYPEWGVTIVDGWPEAGKESIEVAGVLDTSASPAPFGISLAEGSSGGLPIPSLPPPPDPGLLAQAAISNDIAKVLELGSVVRASNSWVLGGERSRSRKPLLANDMHLALNAPNIWFLVGLHAPGFDVVGMSLPGAPGVIAGHSKAVAWGFTNASADDSDFFIERVNPENPDEYLTPTGWIPFALREEVIQVKGAEPVTMTVRSTRHGPVITPVEDAAGDQILAYQWVAHAPARTFQALLGMNQANNAGEFLESVEVFDNPHQNVVFADTAGAWGYWMGGQVPDRASNPPPHLPVPGWTGEHDWLGWIPFEDKPHVLAPARGYIATANNAQGRGERAQRVSHGSWASPYRAQRISELIEATELHNAESLLALQMDAGSAFVDRRLHVAVHAFRAAGLGDLADRLAAWDGRADLESTEATLFHAWWRVVRQGMAEDYYGGRPRYFPSSVVEDALDGELPIPPGLLENAARATEEFSDIPWGEAHLLMLDHPMAQVSIIGKILRFGRYDIPRVGGPHSVNVAGFGGLEPPFRTSFGPSQRHVVDLADPDGSGGFILPGGQSGYPSNPHSFDQLELWREGRLWFLPLERSLVEGRAVATVRLEGGGG